MTLSEVKIPIKYVGLQRHYKDHIYGSGVGFTRGKVSAVPAWAAAQFLKHPEFEDARPAKERDKPILAAKPAVEVDREIDELDQIEHSVRLDNMTKDQMAAFAMRTYGVRVDASGLKTDVTHAVRGLMKRNGR